MSLLGKKPYLYEVFETLSENQLTSLQGLVNSTGDATVIEFYKTGIAATLKGVRYVAVKLEEHKIVYGFLCYTDTKCGLFAWQDGFEEMDAIKLDPTNKTYLYMHEHLHAEEFRRTIDDFLEGSEGGTEPWVTRMKPVLDYDTTDKVIVASKKVEIEGQDGDGVGLVVDEKSEFGGNVTISGNVYCTDNGFVQANQVKVNNITFFDTPEGETPAVNIVNADLKIGTTGQSKKIYLNGVEFTGGGGHLYEHMVTIKNSASGRTVNYFYAKFLSDSSEEITDFMDFVMKSYSQLTMKNITVTATDGLGSPTMGIFIEFGQEETSIMYLKNSSGTISMQSEALPTASLQVFSDTVTTIF